MVVVKRGQSQGIDISLKIKSKIHIIVIFTTMPKSPRVIIRNGRVIRFITGFKKKLSKPKTMPKSKIICHCAVRGTPKKFESEYMDSNHIIKRIIETYKRISKQDFYKIYPGYLSSHDSERAGDELLKKTAEKIRMTAKRLKL